MYFKAFSNSTYPQHSGERYKIDGPLVNVPYEAELYSLTAAI